MFTVDVKRIWFKLFDILSVKYPIEPNSIYKKYGQVGAMYFSMWWLEQRNKNFTLSYKKEKAKIFW